MIVRTIAKMVLALAAILVMLVFSQMNAGTLLAASVGAVLIMLGISMYYRPASVVGLMVTAAAVAISSNPGSLTEVPSLLAAVIGLLIPLYLLTWATLSSGSQEPGELRFRSRASLYTIIFMSACSVSVPIWVLLLGIVSPRISMAVSLLTEIAIVLAVATAGIILITAQAPKKASYSGPSREAD